MTENCSPQGGDPAADARFEAAEAGAAARSDSGAAENASGNGQPPPMPADPATIDRLVAEHADAIYRYAYRLTGRAADAEDLTQQTFLIAQRKIVQIRNEQSARAWLMTVMRRTYCRLQNHRRAERERTVPLDVESLPAEEISDHWEIDRELLQTAIDELPDEYKLVLLSFYFENLSYREMAERFDLPIGTVMSRLSRAKSHLRFSLFESELQSAAGSVIAEADGNLPRRGDA